MEDTETFENIVENLLVRTIVRSNFKIKTVKVDYDRSDQINNIEIGYKTEGKRKIKTKKREGDELKNMLTEVNFFIRIIATSLLIKFKYALNLGGK